MVRLRGSTDDARPLQDAEARELLARWDGFRDWAHLAAERAP